MSDKKINGELLLLQAMTKEKLRSVIEYAKKKLDTEKVRNNKSSKIHWIVKLRRAKEELLRRNIEHEPIK